MKRTVSASLLVVFVLTGLADCGKQQVEAEQGPPPRQQEASLTLDKDGDVLSFQTGSSYVLSVEQRNVVAARPHVRDAFKKFHAEVKKLEEQGWVLEPTSVQISRTEYSAWIVTTFRKKGEQ